MIALYSSSFATALSVRFCCSAIALTASMTRGSSLYIFETVSTCGRPDPLRRPPCVVFGFVRLRGMQSFRVAQWEVWVLQNSLLARVERSAIAKLRRITYKVEIVHKVHFVCSIIFMVIIACPPGYSAPCHPARVPSIQLRCEDSCLLFVDSQ